MQSLISVMSLVGCHRGPLLFLIFPNIIHSPSLLFADNTKIFRRITSHLDYIQLQQDILALEKWLKLWQLNFNYSKTFVMHLGKYNPDYIYNMSGMQLETVQEHKDLGVLVDSELKFHHHSCNVTNKASQVLGIIKKSLDSYMFPRTLTIQVFGTSTLRMLSGILLM